MILTIDRSVSMCFKENLMYYAKWGILEACPTTSAAECIQRYIHAVNKHICKTLIRWAQSSWNFRSHVTVRGRWNNQMTRKGDELVIGITTRSNITTCLKEKLFVAQISIYKKLMKSFTKNQLPINYCRHSIFAIRSIYTINVFLHGSRLTICR